MASEKDEALDLEAAGVKKSPLVPVILGVNMLLVLGVGAYLLLGSGASSAQGAAAPAVPVAVGEPGSIPIDPGTFVAEEMKAFIVNLHGEDGNRYFKVALTVRLVNEGARERFTTVQPAVRDAFIRYLTGLTLDDLATPEKKQELKRHLIGRANQVTQRGDVLDVYFTEFVVQ